MILSLCGIDFFKCSEVLNIQPLSLAQKTLSLHHATNIMA
jgi:hypothetical protein